MPSPSPIFAVGDYVVLDHLVVGDTYRGIVYRVVKVNKVNFHLTPINGGKTLSVPMYAARPATDIERAAAEKIAQAAPTPLLLGSVVTVRGREGHHVVVALPGGRTDRWYRVAPLGGTETNTYLVASRGHLELVDPSNIHIAA